MRAQRGRSKGFTLIELLIVIIIIGILAAIAIPMFLGQRDKAKESAVKGGVHNIELGIGSYAVDYQDQYPATAHGLQPDASSVRGQLAAEPVDVRPHGRGHDARQLHLYQDRQLVHAGRARQDRSADLHGPMRTGGA